MRICTTCKLEQPIDNFSKRKIGRNGFNSRCKKCASKANAIYNATRKEIQKQYHLENREKHNAYAKVYHHSNKTEIKKSREQNFQKRIRYITTACSQNARSRNLEFAITPEVVMLILILQDNKCKLTKIPFVYEFSNVHRTNPFAPSIDRIDNTKGYHVNNIQLVCSVVNMAKSEYPIDVFDAICTARVKVLNNG